MTRVLVPAAIDAAGPALGGRVHAIAGETMGTTWSVRFVASPDADVARWTRDVQACLDQVVAQMSTWWPDSDLCRFNRLAAGDMAVLPADCATVLQCALDVARRSGGAFDPTAGPLVNRWGFGPPPTFADPHFRPPAADEVQALVGAVGWSRLAVEAGSNAVVQPGGVVLDFSGIAKGFGVDQVAALFVSRGLNDVLVDVGGELRGLGIKPDGQPWWVALELPPGAAGHLPPTRVALHGLAVATSGNYRRWFDREGRRHAHTLDPRTGWPVDNGVASVTVVHAATLWADAWSTALTVLGADDGRALADREQLAAHWVVQGSAGRWHEHTSVAFDRLAA